MNPEHDIKLYRVLILDADFNTALTILRSLSKLDILCDIASATTNPICQSSRYAKSFFQYPDPLLDSENFTHYISTLLQKNQYDLVIPVTERSLIPLSESEKLDPWRKILAISDREGLLQVLDKSKTMSLAEKCNIPIPFSYPASSIEEIESFAEKLNYPIVLKPGQSIPNAKQRKQLSVCYAHNPEELKTLSKDLLPYCQLLIQQYVQGIGTGIELLANHGKIVYAFQHQRLHEMPLTGGGSCLRKSISINSELLLASEKLISELNWHGVAMVEFKWDPETEKYWLMEINGRFWGSLPLADAAGADFPKMLFNLLVLNRLPESINYQENIFCRKLSSDIYWLESVIRRSEDPHLVTYPSKSQIVRDLVLMFHPTKHFFDVQSLSDPLPGLIDLWEILKQNTSRVYGLLHFKALKYYHASSFMKKRLEQQVKKSNNILFLCYGNINRSALAEAIATQNSQSPEVTFVSAGFHLSENRPADPDMVKTASHHNIDLSHSRSLTINATLINQADIILAMEIEHLNRLSSIHPSAKNKSFLLGTLTANQSGNVEIIDPYGLDTSTFENIFQRIKLSISELNKSF